MSELGGWVGLRRVSEVWRTEGGGGKKLKSIIVTHPPSSLRGKRGGFFLPPLLFGEWRRGWEGELIDI